MIRKRVLIVDEPDEVWALSRRLEGLGCECVVAAGLGEALRCLEDDEFDVVFTELLGWPEPRCFLDLLEACARRGGGARFYVLTGKGTIKSAVAAIQGGATNYLMKPVSDCELASLLK